MQTSHHASLDIPLVVVTSRRPQSPDANAFLDDEDSLASPAQRQSRVSVRGRAEKYIEQASLSPDGGRQRVAAMGDPSAEWSPPYGDNFGRSPEPRRDGGGHHSQKEYLHKAAGGGGGRSNSVAPSPLNVFFASPGNQAGEGGGDEYLRRLGDQYSYSLSLERTGAKIGRHPPPTSSAATHQSSSSFSNLPQQLERTESSGGDRWAPNKTYRSLLERELAERENDPNHDYENNGTRHNWQGQYDNANGGGVIVSLKPAVPPVKKKIMRRQSSLMLQQQHQLQQQPALQQQQPPQRSMASAVSLMTLNELSSAAAFRSAAPPLTAPKSVLMAESIMRQPGSRGHPQTATPATVAVVSSGSGIRLEHEGHDAQIQPRAPVDVAAGPEREYEALTPDVPVKNRIEWLESTFPYMSKAGAHTVAVYDSDRPNGIVHYHETTFGNTGVHQQLRSQSVTLRHRREEERREETKRPTTSNGRPSSRPASRATRLDPGEQPQQHLRVENGDQYGRRSPAARFFASEYEQMRLAGFEEDDGYGGSGLLLKPVASAANRHAKIGSSGTPRTFVSPRTTSASRPNEMGYGGGGSNTDLVVCTVDQLKELVGGDRRGGGDQADWDILHRPQPQYRPVITPRPQVPHAQRRLVDKSAQTHVGVPAVVNGDWRDQQKATDQYADQRHQQQYEEQRRLTEASQYVQYQQRMDEERVRSTAGGGFGDRPYSAATEYEFDDLHGRGMRSTSPTWRRLYYVDQPMEVVKNRITRSQEVLNDERYQIDIGELRNRFLEKPEYQPRVQRTGRVWQPPPDQAYDFPTPRAPFRRFVEYIEDKEHMWKPFVYEPDLKYEKQQPPSTGVNGYQQHSGTSDPNGYPSAAIPPQPAYAADQGNVPQQQQRRHELAPQGVPTIEISPGYSSIGLSEQLPSGPNSAMGGNTPYPHGQQQQRSESSSGTARLENEPTPRHPSTMTVYDKPRVNIKDKIQSFETEGGEKTTIMMVMDPRVPRREFGVYHPRPRSTSIDDDLMSSPHSSADRRSVHFANGAQPGGTHGVPGTYRKIQPPPQIQKKELEDLAELAQRRERLLDRARHRSAVNVHELRKVEADVPPVPTRDRYKELIEEAVVVQSNGYTASHQQHDASELTRSQSLLTSEWEFAQRPPKSLSQTNLASWKFSGASFSPRSVVSINGHQDGLGDQLRIRTDLSPAPPRQIVHKSNASVQTQVTEQQQAQQPQQPQFWPAVLVPLGAAGTPTSTMTKEFKEETKRTREVERYSSLNDLNDGHGTLIKIQDESARRPKSIMKSHRRNDDKQLVVKENWDTSEHRAVNGGHEIVRQIAPKVTETVSTVEETKRTEEVERRGRESKEKKKSSKKRSGGSGHHRESRHHRSSSSNHAWGPRPGDADYPPWTAPFGEILTSIENETNEISTIFVDVADDHDDFWPQSHFERESPNAIWRQQAITANGHGHSGSQKYNSGGGQQHVSESYHRSGHGGSSSEARQNGHHRNGQRSRVHKSQSSREVYNNDLPEEYEGSRGARGSPYVEYPPTLPRDHNGQPIRVQHQHRNGDGHHNDMVLHKTRSYNDWDGEHRGGKDTSLMRKWEADMTGLERDFRDSLLMPMPGPGQNVNEREHREENIPGGHETFNREVHANSGSRPGAGGNTRYSEAKQELSFRREQASDRRPY